MAAARHETVQPAGPLIAAAPNARQTGPLPGARRTTMPDTRQAGSEGGEVTRQQLIEALNGDLSREYQAIIAYVIYSQTLKGAAYMSIAKELVKHAGQELAHALTIAKQIDY